MKKAIIIVTMIIIIASVIVGYFLLTRTVWPMVFQLTNTGTTSIQVPVYINGQNNNGSPVTLPPNQPISITLAGTNPRTNSPYTSKQVKNVSIYLNDSQSIKYNPVKMPNITWVHAPNISGLAPDNTNPGTNWTKKGYYVATIS